MATKSKFIIVKHKAKRAGDHFDLRFKIPGKSTWDSFAIRKDIPIEPNKKVLAIKTHVHSEKEALFTGEIKSGYGAGTLTEWDSGSCMIQKYTPIHIIINFKGKKIKGIYHLISTVVMSKEKNNFMFFKGKS